VPQRAAVAQGVDRLVGRLRGGKSQGGGTDHAWATALHAPEPTVRSRSAPCASGPSDREGEGRRTAQAPRRAPRCHPGLARGRRRFAVSPPGCQAPAERRTQRTAWTEEGGSPSDADPYVSTGRRSQTRRVATCTGPAYNARAAYLIYILTLTWRPLRTQ
jgi:hypothetical protein